MYKFLSDFKIKKSGSALKAQIFFILLFRVSRFDLVLND